MGLIQSVKALRAKTDFPEKAKFCLRLQHQDTRVAQSVKRLTLDLSSGHDLTVREFNPRLRLCTASVEPAWSSLSLSLCPSVIHALSLSLKINT